MDNKILVAYLFSSQGFYELSHFINAQNDYKIRKATLYLSHQLDIELPIDLAHHWNIIEDEYQCLA